MEESKMLDLTPAERLRGFFNEKLPAFKQVLPAHVSEHKFVTVLLNSIWKNETLRKCDTYSLYQAALELAELGLMAGGYSGQACLVPYWSSKRKRFEAQAQIMYQGLIELVARAGDVSDIRARIVFSGDHFDYQYGLDDKLVHKPSNQEEKGEPTHCYAYIKYKDGFRAFEVMTIEQINKIRDNTQAVRKGRETPWTNEVGYFEMCKKTVIKRLLKSIPKTIEKIRVAINQDEEQEFGVIRQGVSGHIEAKTEQKIEEHTKSEEPEEKSEAKQTSFLEGEAEEKENW